MLCLLALTLDARVALAWHSTALFQDSTHQRLLDEGVGDVSSSQYPDIHLSTLRAQLRLGANSEDSHNDPTIGVHYWRGSEPLWRAQAMEEYETFRFTSAYLHLGYAIHVLQDSFVPAHQYVIPHGLQQTIQLDPDSPGVVFTIPSDMVGLDGFEEYAQSHHDSSGPGDPITTLFEDPLRGCSARFWYGDDESSPDDDVFGSYGWNPNGSCDVPTTPNGLDWFTGSRCQVPSAQRDRVVRNQLYLARKATADDLRTRSVALPPLVRSPLRISIGSLGPCDQALVRFEALENRARDVRITLSVGVGGPALRDTEGNLWDDRVVSLSIASELPWGGSFSIPWSGDVASGPLPDGSYTLTLRIVDMDGNTAPARDVDGDGRLDVEAPFTLIHQGCVPSPTPTPLPPTPTPTPLQAFTHPGVYPNPCGEQSARIALYLRDLDRAEGIVETMSSLVIRRLTWDKADLTDGEVIWDLLDDHGARVANGLYTLRLRLFRGGEEKTYLLRAMVLR